MRRATYFLVVLAAGALVAVAPAVARPKPPAPQAGGTAPPPAWIETERGDIWLAYSTYCWTANGQGMCADYIDPSRRKDLPRVVVRRGEVARIHLGFVPQSATLRIGATSRALPAGRILGFKVTRPGVLVLFTYGKKGDASFAARLVVR